MSAEVENRVLYIAVSYLGNSFSLEMASAVVIDASFYKGKRAEYVFKELAVYNTWESLIQSWTFKEKHKEYLVPRGIQIENRKRFEEEVGLPWEFGELPYREVITCLRFVTGCALFAFGAEKCRLFSSILGRQVTDLLSLGCPPAESLPYAVPSCIYHKGKTQLCVLRKCLLYGTWLSQYSWGNVDKMEVE